MFARKIRMKLKPNSAIEFSRLFDHQILPELRKQQGFKDGLTLVSGERSEAVAISFWDNRESADSFATHAYEGILDRLESVLADRPDVSTLVVSNSTSHGVASARR